MKFQAVQDRTGIVDGLKKKEKKNQGIFWPQGQGMAGQILYQPQCMEGRKVAKAEVAAPAENGNFPPTNFEPFYGYRKQHI